MAGIYQKLALVSVSAALSFSVLDVNTAQAASFTFTKIADTSNSFSSVGGVPAINDNGVVAFFAELDAGGSGIFTSSGGEITTIADDSGRFSLFSPNIAINNSDTVVFKSYLDTGGSGIFTSSGGEITTIAESSLPYPFSFFAPDPDINNNGVVAFTSELNRKNSLLTSSGGEISTIADSPSFNSFSSFDINDRGTVTFLAYPGNGSAAFFSNRNGLITTIVSENNPYILAGGYTAINNSDTLAFFAHEWVNQEYLTYLLTVSNGEFTKIVDDTGFFKGFYLNPAINDNGMVVFPAFLDEEGSVGIFTGADPLTDKVIATGDTLFGSKVKDIFFVKEGLNNLGQIAFFAQFENGTTGIFRADPVSEPPPKPVYEPASIIGLLAFSAFGSASVLKKKR